MKKISAFILPLLLAFSLSACNSSKTGTSPQPTESVTSQKINLEGSWKQTNVGPEEDYQTATINNGSIEIKVVNRKENTTSTYWSGTYTTPELKNGVYTWVSENNMNKNESPLVASSENSKTFYYANGVISYESNYLGTEKTVKLEKA